MVVPILRNFGISSLFNGWQTIERLNMTTSQTNRKAEHASHEGGGGGGGGGLNNSIINI